MIVLATGAGGQVGSALVREAQRRGIRCIAADRTALDITAADAVAGALTNAAPDVVVNLAAYTRVDAAETDADAAFAVNAAAVGALGHACDRAGLPLLHVSTDYVFDGTARRPYVESDAVRPINVYGSSKAAGEAALRGALDRHIIVRTSWVFGAPGDNFVRTMLRLAGGRDEVRVVADEVGCPTAADDLAGTLLTLAARAAAPGFADWGTYHYCGAPALSRAAFARAIYETADRVGGLRTARVENIASADFPAAARRPAASVLDCSRIARVFGIRQEEWRIGLERMVRAVARDGGA